MSDNVILIAHTVSYGAQDLLMRYMPCDRSKELCSIDGMVQLPCVIGGEIRLEEEYSHMMM